VELIVNPSDEVIPRLRADYGLERLDFVFMDHWKKCYLPDLQVTPEDIHSAPRMEMDPPPPVT